MDKLEIEDMLKEAGFDKPSVVTVRDHGSKSKITFWTESE